MPRYCVSTTSIDHSSRRVGLSDERDARAVLKRKSKVSVNLVHSQKKKEETKSPKKAE